MISRLKRWLAGRERNGRGASKENRPVAGAFGPTEGYAEAGLPDTAQEMAREAIQERPKILVLGPEGVFSRPVVDYAVGFAKRTGYEIVALSCVSASGAAGGGGEALIRRAAEQEVPCRHVVKHGASDHCIREVHDEFRRVEFVITEPEAGFENETEPVIPVFCLSE